MKYQEALIAWTPGTDKMKIGPLLKEGEQDWTEPFFYTGGAAYVALRKCKSESLRNMMLFVEFHSCVVRDRIPVDVAHKEFLKIDEYRARISPDIPGADVNGDVLGGWL